MEMIKNVFLFLNLFVFINLYVSLPISKEKKEEPNKYDMKYSGTEGLTLEQAQDQEYFRYLTQIFGEMAKDPFLNEKLNNATEEDIRSGKLADYYDNADLGLRKRIDEIKRMEVEYQRDLLRQSKDHMKGIERNYWNPIHHDNKETFEKGDLKKLLTKHHEMIYEKEKKRKKEFKSYEMKKEHERRENMKKLSEEQRAKEEDKNKKMHHRTHQKIHEPGHKDQLTEVWEKDDGLDAESFDEKTLFNLHDKNSDGYLDSFEIDTLFLTELNKVYNESDDNFDERERNEEMARMREHVVKNMDKDSDGLISLGEFLSKARDEDFKEDKEWKPLVDEDQFSEEELREYERNEEQNGNEEEKEVNEIHPDKVELNIESEEKEE